MAERELCMLFLRQGDGALHDRSLSGCAVECCEDALVTESHDNPFRCARRLGACADVFRSARACATRSRARVLGLLYRNVRPPAVTVCFRRKVLPKGFPAGKRSACSANAGRAGCARLPRRRLPASLHAVFVLRLTLLAAVRAATRCESANLNGEPIIVRYAHRHARSTL